LLEDGQPKIREELKKAQKIKKESEEKSYVNPELAEQSSEKGKEFFKAGKWGDAISE
jgi:hypothetical protein